MSTVPFDICLIAPFLSSSLQLIENIGRADKLDNTFSRSRSSSMSSLENITSEAVTCLAFVDSYTKKSGKQALKLIHIINIARVTSEASSL
jgi:hypothetical protein